MSSSPEPEGNIMPFALAISISTHDLLTVLHMRNRLSRTPRLSGEGSPSSLAREVAREVALELEKDLLDYLGTAEQTDAVVPSQEISSEDSAMTVEEDGGSVPLRPNPGATNRTSDFIRSSSASSSAFSSHSLGKTAEDSDSDYDCDETIITNYCKLRAKGLIPATPPVTPRRVQ
ncbi:hypothetical protein BJ165DRAFT_1535340 [Panaeolus papilionaceus]|nr:hypothetical protein BJ165DRAFT_1535340 [Panaeolus papilionaceus]